MFVNHYFEKNYFWLLKLNIYDKMLQNN